VAKGECEVAKVDNKYNNDYEFDCAAECDTNYDNDNDFDCIVWQRVIIIMIMSLIALGGRG
jgi:hypothetical protein